MLVPTHLAQQNGAPPGLTVATPINDIQILTLAAAALPVDLSPQAAVERAALLCAEAIALTRTTNLGDLVEGIIRRRQLAATVGR